MKKNGSSVKKTNKFTKSFLIPGTLTWGMLGLASLLKLWIVAGQHLDIISVSLSPYDQGLFFTLATYIKKGLWLGPYNNLTLAKGPFYPMYVSTMSSLHTPLLLSQQLLYVIACFVLLISL